ncbi:hypothetical protein BIW11_02448 [Tropilaelaps mercedesae]|uniref:Uncharacterized protein n=1 Tax=Tropilaelaps mercedesae TaxID=418985 RepID=A0A1V9Y2W8_9ACAR|nr:hypothetical protein BIW11_02448 [Tropilaelaps mercedesae]
MGAEDYNNTVYVIELRDNSGEDWLSKDVYPFLILFSLATLGLGYWAAVMCLRCRGHIPYAHLSEEYEFRWQKPPEAPTTKLQVPVSKGGRNDQDNVIFEQIRLPSDKMDQPRKVCPSIVASSGENVDVSLVVPESVVHEPNPTA